MENELGVIVSGESGLGCMGHQGMGKGVWPAEVYTRARLMRFELEPSVYLGRLPPFLITSTHRETNLHTEMSSMKDGEGRWRNPEHWPSRWGYTWRESRLREGDASVSAQQRAESQNKNLWEMPNLGRAITFCTDLSKDSIILPISWSNLEVGVWEYISGGTCGRIWGRRVIAPLWWMAAFSSFRRYFSHRLYE